MNLNTALIAMVFMMIFVLGNHLQDQHLETQAEIQSLRSEILSLTEELYKERVEFCRGIKRAEENRGEAIH